MDINTLYRPGRKLFLAQKTLYSFLAALRPFLGLNTNYFQHLLSFSHSVVSDSLQLHGMHPAKLPCPSPSPRACSYSCPLSQQCHPTISSSVVPFSSCLQSFLAPGSFPMSWLFASGGQSIGASASMSVLPMDIQDCFPLRLTGLMSLQSKRL